MTECGLRIIADCCFFKVRLADETVVAASEADIFLFPPQKGNSVSKCGVPQSDFLASDGKSEWQEDFALYFCFDKDESTAMVVPLRAF